jgi:sterol desaturase/sphingolipid hydroxylase (fatty acid hydroxylase superfamily)
MDWMVTVGDCGLGTVAWLGGLAVAFGVLTCLTPCNPGMHWWKAPRAAATDVLYWFVGPLSARLFRVSLLAGATALLFGGTRPRPLQVAGWPVWAQCLAVLVIQDIPLYWLHRFFHCRPGWRFHAVHHSPRVLDWTATQRFHPVNEWLAFGLADVAVLLAGFPPAVLVLLTPFNVAYSAMVHANLNWTFGPLRYVLASPVFHRWHHTTQAEGLDKNFASTLPILDVIFGTFHMPPGELPARFGNGDPDFPDAFGGQLLYPFRRKRAHPAVAAPAEPVPTREAA